MGWGTKGSFAQAQDIIANKCPVVCCSTFGQPKHYLLKLQPVVP